MGAEPNDGDRNQREPKGNIIGDKLKEFKDRDEPSSWAEPASVRDSAWAATSAIQERRRRLGNKDGDPATTAR